VPRWAPDEDRRTPAVTEASSWCWRELGLVCCSRGGLLAYCEATAPAGLPESVRSPRCADAGFHGADFSAGYSGDRRGASPASSDADLSQPLKAGSPGTRVGTLAAAAVLTGCVEVALALGTGDRDGSPGAQPLTLSHRHPGIRPQGVVTFAIFSAPRYDLLSVRRAVSTCSGAIARFPVRQRSRAVEPFAVSGSSLPGPSQIPGAKPDAQAIKPCCFRTIPPSISKRCAFPCAAAEPLRRTDVALASHVATSMSARPALWPKQNPVGTYITLSNQRRLERISDRLLGRDHRCRERCAAHGLADEPSPRSNIRTH